MSIPVSLIKVNDSTYRIITEKRTEITTTLDKVTSPFGLEEFARCNYVNWAIDSDTAELFKEVEENLMNKLIETDARYASKKWKWTTTVRERAGYETLLKTRIKKTKNTIVTQCPCSIYELNFKQPHDVTLIIDSVWVSEKTHTFGILLIVKSITC